MPQIEVDPRKGRYWDRAWTLIEGCKEVEIPGVPSECDHCWARAASNMRGHRRDKVGERHHGLVAGGHWTGEVRVQRDQLDKPLRRRKPTIYSVWNDLFHEKVPDHFIDEAWMRMRATPQHTYLVLTKRPERMAEHTARRWQKPLPNVWLGTTAGTQKALEERWPHVARCLAAVRFLSMEPLLERVCTARLPFPDWIIAGVETGPKKRPADWCWFRSIRDQCQAADVPFWLKMGPGGSRVLDGREWNEMPETI